MAEASTTKPVIGLAGGIGAGKSLVARQLASLGCGVIDADALARAVLEEPQVQKTLRKWWGEQVIGPDGGVDRAALARRVFEDPEALTRLEGLIHPRVHARRRALRERMMADPQVTAIVEDCPLLFEAGIDRTCDATIFIDADRATRLSRVAASRGWDEAELHRRESRQQPLDNKAARADYKVNNGSDEQYTLEQVRGILEQIMEQRSSS